MRERSPMTRVHGRGQSFDRFGLAHRRKYASRRNHQWKKGLDCFAGWYECMPVAGDRCCRIFDGTRAVPGLRVCRWSILLLTQRKRAVEIDRSSAKSARTTTSQTIIPSVGWHIHARCCAATSATRIQGESRRRYSLGMRWTFPHEIS